MAQFAAETRKWLLTVIRQRKRLMHYNRSYKPEANVRMALDTLNLMLLTYQYENDLHMAMFFRQQLGNIAMILPGAGSTLREKRERELEYFKKRALLISDARAALRTIEQNTQL
jgi:hypothetical protein